MLKFLKKNAKNLLLVASLVLNALGGAGVIPPVVAEKAGGVVEVLAK